MNTITDLASGADLRLPQHRREAFIRFWLWSCRYGVHPGCVYLAMPWLRRTMGWGEETALWFAFINGNTQNVATSLLLWQQCPDPRDARRLTDMIGWFNTNWARLPFDLDRRHQKRDFPMACMRYADAYAGHQGAAWRSLADQGWPALWSAASTLHGFGRLSAYSYLEYLSVTGIPVPEADLMIGDPGSASHRNGLCLVLGLDHWVSTKAQPVTYTAEMISTLDIAAADLLAEARDRAAGQAGARQVTNFTLESALCTYKSWHKPNRRYPGVYADMMYNRILAVERDWPGTPVGTLLRRCRDACLPDHLAVERTPYDPGLCPAKQNWYLTTGQTVTMGRDDPQLWSGFDDMVDMGAFGTRAQQGRREKL
jgi:hypothetical protein